MNGPNTSKLLTLLERNAGQGSGTTVQNFYIYEASDARKVALEISRIQKR
jgi:hypothetical protein